ncbi:MAG: hypothetical protein PHW96_02335 [Candidatus Nanoarchaeia archaeon]|nr:hypothetical protein [Candidatus Nanoarchaeia archaeon]
MASMPENNEIVLCTVKKILPHSIFVSLEKYPDVDAMLHISEVSSSWVKNIRDFVSIGKSIVCKVVRVNPKSGQVDVSLKRVKDFEKKEFLKDVKKEKKIEKLIEFSGKKVGYSKKDIEGVKKTILEQYDSLSDFFDYYDEGGESIVKELGLDKKFEKEFAPMLSQIKENKKIVLKYEFSVSSTAPDGVSKIKDFFEKLGKEYGAEALYLGSSRYHVKFTVKTNKEIKKLINDVDAFCKKASSKDFKVEYKEQ